MTATVAEVYWKAKSASGIVSASRLLWHFFRYIDIFRQMQTLKGEKHLSGTRKQKEMTKQSQASARQKPHQRQRRNLHRRLKIRQQGQGRELPKREEKRNRSMRKIPDSYSLRQWSSAPSRYVCCYSWATSISADSSVTFSAGSCWACSAVSVIWLRYCCSQNCYSTLRIREISGQSTRWSRWKSFWSCSVVLRSLCSAADTGKVRRSSTSISPPE